MAAEVALEIQGDNETQRMFQEIYQSLERLNTQADRFNRGLGQNTSQSQREYDRLANSLSGVSVATNRYANATEAADDEILKIRTSTNLLNKTILEQRRALLTATDEEKRAARQRIAAVTTQKQSLAIQREEIRIQQTRERQMTRTTNATRRSTVAYGSFVDRLADSTVILSQGAFYLGAFLSGVVRVGAETERYQAVLRVTEENSTALYRRLQALNRELIGTDFSTINRLFTTLRGTGAEIESSFTIIEGFSKALGTLSVAAEEQTRFFTQLSQAYSRNQFEADEFKTFQEILPNILKLSSRALGQQVNSYEDLNRILKESNLSVREYIENLASFSAVNLPGVDPNTYTAQAEQLNETIRAIQRNIGSALIPILARGAREVRTFFETFQGVRGRDILLFTSSIAGVTAAVSTTSVALRSLTKGTMPALVQSVGSSIVAFKNWGSAVGAMQVSLAAALPIITATTLAIGYLATRAAVAANSTTELQEAFAKIGDAFTFDEVLGRQRRFLDLSIRQLQAGANAAIDSRRLLDSQFQDIADQFNIPQRQLIIGDPTEVLRAYNVHGSGVDALVERLQNLQTEYRVVVRTIDTYRNRIRELTTESASVATPQATQDLRNYALELVNAGDNISQLQTRLRSFEVANRQFLDTVKLTTDAIRNREAIALAQVDAEIAAQQKITDNEKASVTERAQANEQLLTLAARRRRIEVQASNDIANTLKIETDLRKETRETFERYQRNLRMATQNTVNTAVNGFRSLGSTISENASQLLGFGNRLRQTVRAIQESYDATAAYYESLRAITRTFQRQNEDFHEQFRAQLRTTTGYLIGVAARLNGIVNDAQTQIRLPRGFFQRARRIVQQFNQEREQSTLETINRIRQQEEDLYNIRLSLNNQLRDNLIDGGFELVFNRNVSFKEIAVSFIRQSLRIVVQNHFETQAILRNNQRLIASNREVAASRAQAFFGGGGGAGNATGILGGIPFGNIASSLSGGGLALGVSAALFPSEFSNLGTEARNSFENTASGLLDNTGDIIVEGADILLNLPGSIIRKIGETQTRLLQGNRAVGGR